jgi:capsular exopolysaccharide synthesis family protein
MKLLQYWRLIYKRLWLILLFALVAGSSAYYYKQQQTSRYSTTTTLYLNPGVGSTLPFQSSVTIQSLANTYSEFMRTRSFARSVKEKLGKPMTELAILKALSTQYVANTQFFRIIAVHPDPLDAQKLANTAAEVLIVENIVRQQAQQQQVNAQSDPEKMKEREQLAAFQTVLQDELAGYDTQIMTLRDLIADLETQPQSAATDDQLRARRAELRDTQGLRINVLSSLSQTQATLATSGSSEFTIDTAVIVDVAPLPDLPLPRGTLPAILLAVFMALAAGVGLTLLLEYVDFTIRTPEALDAAYGMPTLGVVGVVNGRRAPQEKGFPLIALHDPFSPTSEALRALRTSIMAATQDAPFRSLLVTSAGPSEGKTFITTNLAISLAKNGARVILVDADLRKPTQHLNFKLQRKPGLTDLLRSPQNDLTEFLHQTALPNLWVIPAGTMPSNPAELLGSPRTAHVMELLKKHVDIVVYDTPPAATVTDAVVLAPRVDAVLQVVGAGTTRINHVLQCRTILQQSGARLIGPMLNRIRADDLGYYANYYFSYSGADGEKADSFWQRIFRRQEGKNSAKAKTR